MEGDNSYLEYIGLITVQNLTDFLRDSRYSRIRALLLNQLDMDRLAMEFRRSYRDNFFEPFKIQGVLIKEDYERTTPPGKIRVVRWSKD